MPICGMFQEVYVKNFCGTALGNAKKCKTSLWFLHVKLCNKNKPIDVGIKPRSFVIVPIDEVWQIYWKLINSVLNNREIEILLSGNCTSTVSSVIKLSFIISLKLFEKRENKEKPKNEDERLHKQRVHEMKTRL
jgi:hypothetical protein